MKACDYPILADENIHTGVIHLLRSEGKDVRSVYEDGLGGVADVEVLASAHSQGRVVLTHWDEEKSQQNLSRHGLSFHDAATVFSGPCVTFADERFDYGEQRFVTLGHHEGRVVVAHTPRGESTRIISMRKANRRDRRFYEERLATP